MDHPNNHKKIIQSLDTFLKVSLLNSITKGSKNIISPRILSHHVQILSHTSAKTTLVAS